MARRKKVELSEVEQARVKVTDALEAFTTASASLDEAAEAFAKAQAENEAIVAAVNAENKQLQIEIDQARKVSSRLVALTA